MVQEEGVLGAAGCMAQDEASNEPGGGEPNRDGGEKSATDPYTRPVLHPVVVPQSHRRIVCAAHFLLAAFLRPSVPRHQDWMQMAAETTDG